MKYKTKNYKSTVTAGSCTGCGVCNAWVVWANGGWIGGGRGTDGERVGSCKPEPSREDQTKAAIRSEICSEDSLNQSARTRTARESGGCHGGRGVHTWGGMYLTTEMVDHRLRMGRGTRRPCFCSFCPFSTGSVFGVQLIQIAGYAVLYSDKPP